MLGVSTNKILSTAETLSMLSACQGVICARASPDPSCVTRPSRVTQPTRPSRVTQPNPLPLSSSASAAGAHRRHRRHRCRRLQEISCIQTLSANLGEARDNKPVIELSNHFH
jgi:hypothetical protein